MRGPRIGCALLALMAILAVTPAGAWDRGRTETFAVVPYLPGKVPVSIEGLTVGPDGTVYAPSFGFNSDGEVTATPHLFSFWPNGNLRKDVALVNPSGPPQPSPHLLGLVYQQSSKSLLICDLIKGVVWQSDPLTGKSSVFMDTGLGSNAGLNALTFDKAGNVYVSELVSGGHLEDRPDRRAANHLCRLADAVPRGRGWGDPDPALWRQRRRVQQ